MAGAGAFDKNCWAVSWIILIAFDLLNPSLVTWKNPTAPAEFCLLRPLKTTGILNLDTAKLFLAQLTKQEGGRSSLSGGLLHTELGFLDLVSGEAGWQLRKEGLAVQGCACTAARHLECICRLHQVKAEGGLGSWRALQERWEASGELRSGWNTEVSPSSCWRILLPLKGDGGGSNNFAR